VTRGPAALLVPTVAPSPGARGAVGLERVFLEERGSLEVPVSTFLDLILFNASLNA